MLLLPVALLLLLGATPGGAGQAPPTARARLAVLDFGGTGGPDGLDAALGQVIRDGLRQVRGVELVPSAALEASARALGLSLAARPSDDDLLRLGRALALRGVVAGRYVADGDRLTVQAVLAEPAGAGRVARGEETSGSLGEFVSLQARAMREVLGRLGLRTSPHDDRRIRAVLAEPTAPPEAYALYGRGVWRQGLATPEGHEEAIRLLTRATEIDQNFALARLALGISLRATNNRWKGSQEIRKAIQVKPDLVEGHHYLAEMLASSPRRPYDLAIQAYQKTLELSPDWAEAWVGLGDVRQAKGEFDEAVRDYRQALALEPDNARVHYGMGKIYYNEKQLYHEAVAEYQRAIALDPGLLEAHLSLGELYEEKGLYPEAIARFGHVLSVDARHPGAAYGLALAYEKVDAARAIAAWERYIELASSLPTEKDWVEIARRHLAKLQREQKH
jgi:tetratricopeptide (TPR) repeat protein